MTRYLLLALASAVTAAGTFLYLTHRRPLSSSESSCHAWDEPDDGVPAMIPYRDTWTQTSGHPTWATSVVVEPLSWDAVVAWPYPKSWPELAD